MYTNGILLPVFMWESDIMWLFLRFLRKIIFCHNIMNPVLFVCFFSAFPRKLGEAYELNHHSGDQSSSQYSRMSILGCSMWI